MCSQMGRPRTRSDAEVLAAAARVMGRAGPDGFTLRAVAAEAGLSPATILQRFRTKRGLLLALHRQSVADLEAAFTAARDHHGPGVAAVAAALSAGVAAIRGPREMANHVAFLALDLAEPDLLAATRRFFDALRGHVRALLAEARPEAGAAALDEATDAVEAAYHGALLAWAVHGRGGAAETVARRVRAAAR